MLQKSRSKLAVLNLFSKYTKHLKIQVQLKKGEDLADRKRAHIEKSVPFAELLSTLRDIKQDVSDICSVSNN